LLVALVAVLGLMAVSAGAASAAGKQRSRTWEVKPGHSIQKVVDKAKSGDTIKLKRGTYYDAVCVKHKGLTIVGAGEGKTVVKPPKKFKKTSCWQNKDEESAFGFDHPDKKVKVSYLTTNGHKGNGVIAVGARHGIEVSHHTGVKHGEYGAAAFDSHGVVFTHDTEIGDGGEAGLYVGDTANAKAYVAHNVMKGWTFGMLMRDSRNGLVKDNTIRANCVGALVLDTAEKVRGGDWALVDNKVSDNNRFCAAHPPVPKVSGNGIVVAGADHVRVEDNKITGHKASKKGEFPSSGLAVVSAKKFGAGDPEYVKVVDNRFKNNRLDIYWDKKGKHIEFKDNDCKTSDPRSICKDSRH
jgi:nitrous oxidase accessory protein NosD